MAISWRQACWRVITPLEAEYKTRPYAEFKQALFDAYPFGTRSHTPYKIWCQEQKLALARHPQSPEYAGTQDDLLARLEESK